MLAISEIIKKIKEIRHLVKLKPKKNSEIFPMNVALSFWNLFDLFNNCNIVTIIDSLALFKRFSLICFLTLDCY